MSTVRKVDDTTELSDGVRVCDYDELSVEGKARLPELIESESTRRERTTAAGFCDCDVVKYTDFYEISC